MFDYLILDDELEFKKKKTIAYVSQKIMKRNDEGEWDCRKQKGRETDKDKPQKVGEKGWDQWQKRKRKKMIGYENDFIQNLTAKLRKIIFESVQHDPKSQDDKGGG